MAGHIFMMLSQELQPGEFWGCQFQDFGLLLGCRVLINLLAEKDLIRTVRFSPDGKYLATGSWGGDLYVSLFPDHRRSWLISSRSGK